MKKEIVFYYDVICPYANLASKLIEDLARRNQANLIWRPVLLGGIYKHTKKEHANIPDNKMIKTYSNQKRMTLGKDLVMHYARYNIPISSVQVPDIRTLNAMRLIASTPSESDKLRSALTHRLFDAIWIKQEDVSDLGVLQNIANSLKFDIDVKGLVEDKKHPSKQILIDNTQEVVDRGAFGVPSIWVNDRLYFGTDRLFFVEQELGNATASPHRLLQTPVERNLSKKLTFYFDFSSPWTFLGYAQIPELASMIREKGVSLDVEFVPILLGGLFKSIGSPMIPMQSMGDNKRRYYTQDFNDWLQYKKMKFLYNSHFPLISVKALRLYLANPTADLRDVLFQAAWVDDKDITDVKILEEIISKAGYDFKDVYEKSQSKEIKQQLITNTNSAVELGISGLPSFQVDDGPIVFGQDRLNIVEDMLLGWKFDFGDYFNKSRL
ncbi:uncharacterized protein [Clytia hemisphaerica]|uniref:DSBA-like thioredoxin domain-containing protein n=1 Tax=Clytia hemisphaerica TaxID=252671 RepID=A0A7M5WUE8_9CNID